MARLTNARDRSSPKRLFSPSTLWRSEPSAHENATNDEAGAVLILALVFLVAVSLIVIGLLTWVGTSLTATAAFSNERSVETAATSAVNLAIQQTRYPTATPSQLSNGGPPQLQLVNVSPPQACFYDTNTPPNWFQPPAFQNQQIDVWCSMVWQPFSANTRVITYSACLSTVTNAQCAATPLLQVIVTFDDYPPGIGVPSANPVPCNLTGFCGQSLTQNSWQWRPTVPTVSSISPTTATVNGTNAGSGQPQTVTVSGNGFVNGSSVNFVQETGLSPGLGVTPSTPNVPTTSNGLAGVIITIPSSQVTFSGCSGPNNTNCTLSVTAPAVTSGTDYFVTVTTPGGTSAYVQPVGSSNPDDLQLTTVTPVVTGVTGTLGGGVPGGSITGGTTITVSGSGFWSAGNFAAQVIFCAASPCTGSNKFQGTNVKVSSNGTVTATSPSVSTPSTYYVQVSTLGGTSTNTSSSVSFNYVVQVPIIISLSATNGTCPAANGVCSVGHGTQLTITGGNFLPLSTVAFYLDSGGNQTGGPISASSTVNNTGCGVTGGPPCGVSMTVTIPSSGLTTNSQYFAVITLPSQYGSLTSQPYNEPADIIKYTG